MGCSTVTQVIQIRRLGVSIGPPKARINQREKNMARALLDSEFYSRLPGEQKLLHVNKHNIRRLTMLWGDPSGLIGEYSGRCYGDCTNIYGKIKSSLRGDVSKLRGDVSGVEGYCTGLEMDCTGLKGDIQALYRLKMEEARFKKSGLFLNKHHFLTNEENERLWTVWQKIANSTMGLSDVEYLSIAQPIKNRPPFSVDSWGRHYEVDTDGNVVCFSINPVDILLLRTNQEIQSCWSIYDKNNRHLRMRLLLARACLNPTVGVCFKIKSVEKFNIFNGLPFRYYKHAEGTFFQYTNKGLCPFGDIRIDITKWFERVCEPIKPYVVGHDAPNSLGHTAQKNLMFYEKYIKPDFSLWKEKRMTPPEGSEHILANFEGAIFLDKDFNVLDKTVDFSDEFVAKQIACLKYRINTGVFNEEV